MFAFWQSGPTSEILISLIFPNLSEITSWLRHGYCCSKWRLNILLIIAAAGVQTSFPWENHLAIAEGIDLNIA
jgi:uncharacterized membrane protein YqaE (UPF0057 family)